MHFATNEYGFVDNQKTNSYNGIMQQFPGLNSFSLICFDFDGLLVDTEPHHFAAYIETFKEINAPLDIDYWQYSELAHGKLGTAALHKALLLKHPHLRIDWEEIRQIKREIYTNRIKKIPVDLMPGVPELLDLALKQKIQICVVTNSLSNDTTAIRKNQPLLNRIPLWITRELYPRGKPFSDGYFKALEHFPGLDPSKVLALDDTVKGIKAIQGANLFPVLICDERHPQLNSAPDVLHYPSLFSLEESLSVNGPTGKIT